MYHHGAAEYLFLTLFNYILYNTIHIQLHIHGIKRLVKATIKHKSEIYLMSYVILSKVHIHRIYKKITVLDRTVIKIITATRKCLETASNNKAEKM